MKQIRESIINNHIADFLKLHPEESTLSHQYIKNFVTEKTQDLICTWCESDDISVSEQIIRNTDNQKVKETICLGCYKMHDQQISYDADQF